MLLTTQQSFNVHKKEQWYNSVCILLLQLKLLHDPNLDHHTSAYSVKCSIITAEKWSWGRGPGSREVKQHWPLHSLGWPVHGASPWAAPGWRCGHDSAHWTNHWMGSEGVQKVKVSKHVIENYTMKFHWQPQGGTLSPHITLTEPK